MAAAEKIPVALQLYSVRHACAANDDADMPAVVQRVAEMGYEGIEFAGYHGRDAGELRKILDDNGLKCAGSHVGLDTLLGDELERSIEFHQALGNRFLIVPGLAEEHRNSAAAWAHTAETFNEIAEKLAPHGMRTGYHNHAVEFAPMDGQKPWDIFFGSTREDVVMQLDVGNAIHGGGDCMEILRKYPGRSGTIHIKEYGGAPEAAVGEGEVHWQELLPLVAETGKTEWYIIEHERNPDTAVEDVGRCIENFRRILGGLGL